MSHLQSLADQVQSCRCPQADPAAAARVLPALSTPVLQVCMSGGAAGTFSGQEGLSAIPVLLPPSLELQQRRSIFLTPVLMYGSYLAWHVTLAPAAYRIPRAPCPAGVVPFRGRPAGEPVRAGGAGGAGARARLPGAAGAAGAAGAQRRGAAAAGAGARVEAGCGALTWGMAMQHMISLGWWLPSHRVTKGLCRLRVVPSVRLSAMRTFYKPARGAWTAAAHRK